MTDPKELVLDVKTVAQIVSRLATSKSPRTVKDAMSISELRALADAALAGIKMIPSQAKPNGLTDEGRMIQQLEADVAMLTLRLGEANARVVELEEKIAKSETGR